MSTTYAGQPGNELTASTSSVSTTTGAAVSPIVVTTAAAHGLQSGEMVQITGVGGNTAANGIWFAVPTSAVAFELWGQWNGATHTPLSATTGNGAYTTGGTVQPLGWRSLATLPSDGDALDAASVNTPIEGQIDRTANLLYKTGAYRLVKSARVYLSAATPATSTGLTGAGLGAAWFAPAPLNLNLYGGASFNTMYFDAWDTDLFEVTLSGYVQVGGGGTPSMALRLAYEMQEYGVAFTGVATAGLLGTAKQYSGNAGVVLTTRQTISAGTRGKKVIFLLQDYLISGAPTYTFYGDIELSVNQFRANS